MKIRIVKPGKIPWSYDFDIVMKGKHHAYAVEDTVEIDLGELSHFLWKGIVANEKDIKNHLEYFIKSKTGSNDENKNS